MPLGMLVALDDFLIRHLFKAVLGLDALEIFDRLAAGLMDHAESNGALGRSGRKHPDGNEREAEIAGPNGNGSHGILGTLQASSRIWVSRCKPQEEQTVSLQVLSPTGAKCLKTKTMKSPIWPRSTASLGFVLQFLTPF